jgi:hypothetical protein
MWDLWWTKWRWGRYSPSISDSTDFSTLIIIRDWYNMPVVASVIVDLVPLHLRKGKKGITFVLNIDKHLPDYTALHPIR